MRLEYVEEKTILGTSGALDNARHLLEDETFIVVNGKIITDIDLDAVLATHRQTGAIATLVLRPNPQHERFSIVHTEAGFIKGFGGLPAPAASDNEVENLSANSNVRSVAEDLAIASKIISTGSTPLPNPSPLMFTGIQILEPRIFSYIPRGVFSHSTTDVYPQAMAKGERIAAHVADGMWYELSTIQRYLEINLKLSHDQGRDVVKGAGCKISKAAMISDSVLWDDVLIEAGAHVRRAVIGDGVRICANELIENLAVVRADLIEGIEMPAKALKGERRGDNFVVPLSQ